VIVNLEWFLFWFINSRQFLTFRKIDEKGLFLTTYIPMAKSENLPLDSLFSREFCKISGSFITRFLDFPFLLENGKDIFIMIFGKFLFFKTSAKKIGNLIASKTTICGRSIYHFVGKRPNAPQNAYKSNYWFT